MPDLAPPVSRAPRSPLATRSGRVLAWVGASAAIGTIVVAGLSFALADARPALTVRLGLDALAVAAAGLFYALLARAPRWSGRSAEPLRALWEPVLVVLGVVGLEVALGTLWEGQLHPKTVLPADLWTAAIGATASLAELGGAVVIALSLRPLVLYRRRQSTVWVWRVMVILALTAPLLVPIAYPDSTGSFDLTEMTSPLGVAFVVVESAMALLMVALAFRQGWAGPLAIRQRLAAAGLALALAATAVGAIVVRFQGPAGVVIVGEEIARIPYAALLSPPLSHLFADVLVFGALFGLTATLVLVFQLPAQDTLAQRAGERRALQALADLSGRLDDREELAQAVARGPVDAGLADAAWVALPLAASGSLAPVVVATAGITPSAAAAAVDAAALASAAADGPVVLTHASADHRVRSRPGDGLGSVTVFALPTRAAGGGALFLSRRSSDAFETDDLSALGTFAAQAALALSHADLFEEALDRERLARELALAREVQQRLLPQSLPELDGLGLAAAERPAREVGGDYYDAVRLGPDCVGLLVADVSGKGAAAAFYMAELKGIFQSASRLTRAPGEFLARANEALGPSLGRGTFVSAVYAVLDAEAATLSLARAGHCPAVLARDPDRPDGGCWLLKSAGLAIGLDRGPLFESVLREQTVPLAPGDAVVLYTDGLVEVRNADGEEFGYDRLAEAVAAHRGKPARALRDALLDVYRAWLGGAEPADDLTLLVLKWDGRPGAPLLPPAPAGPTAPPVAERPAFP